MTKHEIYVVTRSTYLGYDIQAAQARASRIFWPATYLRSKSETLKLELNRDLETLFFDTMSPSDRDLFSGSLSTFLHETQVDYAHAHPENATRPA